MHADLNLIT